MKWKWRNSVIRMCFLSNYNKIMNIKSLIIKKARVLLIVSALCATAGFEASAEDIFAELNDMPHVEGTYVSGRFSHNKKYWSSNSGDRYMNLSKGFSALYTYQCYSTDAVKKARQILKQYVRNNSNVELVMRSKTDGQEYMVYEKFMNEEMISQMVIWNSDGPNVCEVVVIDWDKGLKVTKNPYNSDGNDSSDIYDLPESLKGLERLKELGQLSKLAALGQLGELRELEGLQELSQLGELGAVLGECISSSVGEIMKNYDWEGMVDTIVLTVPDKDNTDYESED